MSIGISSSSGIDMTALYQSLFKKIDSDSDGSISSTEFKTSLSSLDSSSSSTSSTSTADAMFSQLDTDGNGSISETELMNALKQAGEQTRAHMPPPPPPPPPSDANGSSTETSLTDDQKTTVDSILSKYDSSNLTQSDVKSINQAFRDAGISFGKSLGDEVESQGFDIGTMMRLDPPTRDGSDNSATSTGSVDSSSSVSAASSDSSTSATDSTTATTGIDDSLLSGLIQYLSSSSSGSSSGGDSDLLQQVKSSTGMSDTRIKDLFDSFLKYLSSGANYNQSGTVAYSAANTSNLLSVAA